MTGALAPDDPRILEAQLARVRSMLFLPVVGWALLNGAHLAWHFLARRDQRAIESILAGAYAPATGSEAG